MNYRHAYHAGNFADVFKHIIELALLEALLKKDKPFCYLDTHAGVGLYALDSDAAQKTLEYEDGIGRIMTAETIPPLVARYREMIAGFNDHDQLRLYPGSPAIARELLRPRDRAILVELHPTDAESLKQRFCEDVRVAVHHSDAYHALKAFVPPKERRGLVFVDPPFENPEEFSHLVRALQESHRRWPQGIYALWYPIKSRRDVHQFQTMLVKSGIRRQLLLELTLYRDEQADRLNGCGMIIVNPPWQLEETVQPALDALGRHLGDDGLGRSRIEWLVPE